MGDQRGFTWSEAEPEEAGSGATTPRSGPSGDRASDPGASGDPDLSSTERKIWTVGEFVRAARFTIEDAHPYVLVRGEVGNFKPHASGHWYFNLKDDEALLSTVMFRGDNAKVPFELEDGIEVVAGGRPSIYPQWGRFQLIAEILEPVGWGALQLAYEQLKRKLEEEGLFDPSRKRPLPLLPDCVGVVTSESGAAWRDMWRVWARRRVGLRVILAPARVQGPGAAEEIADAIEALGRHDRADVLIVGRGGGSREDLWAFNEEVVARAIGRCPVPVIAAVGHEIDTTIADLVADRRAATPSAAAEIVAPSRDELLGRLGSAVRRVRERAAAAALRARHRLDSRHLQRRLQRPALLLAQHRQRLDEAWNRLDAALSRTLESRRQRLQVAARRLQRDNPLQLALRREQRLERGRERLDRAMAQQLRRRREQLASLAAQVEALSPLAVLGRGYSICQLADGAIVRDAGQVGDGDPVSIRLHRGRLSCTVKSRRLETDADVSR